MIIIYIKKVFDQTRWAGLIQSFNQQLGSSSLQQSTLNQFTRKVGYPWHMLKWGAYQIARKKRGWHTADNCWEILKPIIQKSQCGNVDIQRSKQRVGVTVWSFWRGLHSFKEKHTQMKAIDNLKQCVGQAGWDTPSLALRRGMHEVNTCQCYFYELYVGLSPEPVW